jgi:hypothetical protein
MRTLPISGEDGGVIAALFERTLNACGVLTFVHHATKLSEWFQAAVKLSWVGTWWQDEAGSTTAGNNCGT